MGTIQARKKNRAKNKSHNRGVKTKNYKRDHDQIVGDMEPGNREKLENQPISEDLPGMGQFYCVSCARYFINQKAIQHHNDTKSHKRKLKEALETPPYTQAEADLYGGLANPKGANAVKLLNAKAQEKKEKKKNDKGQIREIDLE
mmetsp:Transcript_23797/g.26974  ORF Transcript_23797/g.26974 Transcript_23797/m.26974 type:complete len:145 (-) Transcript_23797:265-699(-)